MDNQKKEKKEEQVPEDTTEGKEEKEETIKLSQEMTSSEDAKVDHMEDKSDKAIGSHGSQGHLESKLCIWDRATQSPNKAEHGKEDGPDKTRDVSVDRSSYTRHKNCEGPMSYTIHSTDLRWCWE